MIHNGGGETHFVLKAKGDQTERGIIQNSYLEGRRVSKIADQLHRIQCEFVELHCALVRTELFERTGPFDEGLLSTREHIDLCLTAAQAGYPIYCERESVVTYVTGPAFDWWDVTFFMLRWSDAWDLASFDHFREKWNLSEDWYFKKRYNRLGRRRYRALLRPVISRFPFKEHRHWFADVLKLMEIPLNCYISDSYARKHSYVCRSLGLRRKVQGSEPPKPLVTASLLRAEITHQI